MVLEAKYYSFFSKGYDRPFRYDENSHGINIFLFVREDILSKKINVKCFEDFEAIFVESNLVKKKFHSAVLIMFVKSKSHILGKSLDKQKTIYENFLTISDFNS